PHVSLHLSLSYFLHLSSLPMAYTPSLHDALPISRRRLPPPAGSGQPYLSIDSYFLLCSAVTPAANRRHYCADECRRGWRLQRGRSEEHTSELQSRENLVCRLLLEKKKQIYEYKYR